MCIKVFSLKKIQLHCEVKLGQVRALALVTMAERKKCFKMQPRIAQTHKTEIRK